MRATAQNTGPIAGQMVRILKRRIPIGPLSSPPMAATPVTNWPNWARGLGRKWTLVSLFYPNANLVERPPPPYWGNGRPRKKGKIRARPAEVVEKTTQRQTLVVAGMVGADAVSRS